MSNTRVTQLFQPMCYNKATELLAYKCTTGGAGWWLPSWDRAAARGDPIAFSLRARRLARPPASPLPPPPSLGDPCPGDSVLALTR